MTANGKANPIRVAIQLLYRKRTPWRYVHVGPKASKCQAVIEASKCFRWNSNQMLAVSQNINLSFGANLIVSEPIWMSHVQWRPRAAALLHRAWSDCKEASDCSKTSKIEITEFGIESFWSSQDAILSSTAHLLARCLSMDVGESPAAQVGMTLLEHSLGILDVRKRAREIPHFKHIFFQLCSGIVESMDWTNHNFSPDALKDSCSNASWLSKAHAWHAATQRAEINDEFIFEIGSVNCTGRVATYRNIRNMSKLVHTMQIPRRFHACLPRLVFDDFQVNAFTGPGTMPLLAQKPRFKHSDPWDHILYHASTLVRTLAQNWSNWWNAA